MQQREHCIVTSSHNLENEMRSFIPPALIGKTVFDLKGEAIAARATAKNNGTRMSHQQSLQKLAKRYGYNTWEELEAVMVRAGKGSAAESPKAPAVRQVKVDTVGGLYFSLVGEFEYFGLELAEAARMLRGKRRKMVEDLLTEWEFIIPEDFTAWLREEGYNFAIAEEEEVRGEWNWLGGPNDVASEGFPTFEACFVNLLVEENAWARFRSPHNRTLVNCKHCGCYIDLGFADAPVSGERAGTTSDPRVPGDHNDICAPCNYEEGKRGGPYTTGHYAGDYSEWAD